MLKLDSFCRISYLVVLVEVSAVRTKPCQMDEDTVDVDADIVAKYTGTLCVYDFI